MNGNIKLACQRQLAWLTFVLTLGACGGEETHEEPLLPCEVQRVLAARCQGCHQSPTRFGAPTPLLDYADLHATGSGGEPLWRRVGARIADDERPMPPPPNARLSDDEQKLLGDWIEAGGPPAKQGDGVSCGLEQSDPRAVYLDPESQPDDCQNFYEFRAHGDKLDEPWPLPADVGN
ncbi:MAG TPA: hypothetical protein VFZ61_08670, partial [Polyangiales bacterium]